MVGESNDSAEISIYLEQINSSQPNSSSNPITSSSNQQSSESSEISNKSDSSSQKTPGFEFLYVFMCVLVIIGSRKKRYF